MLNHSLPFPMIQPPLLSALCAEPSVLKSTPTNSHFGTNPSVATFSIVFSFYDLQNAHFANPFFSQPSSNGGCDHAEIYRIT